MPGDEVLDQEPGQDVTDDKVKNQHSYHYWHKHGKQRAQLGDVAPPPKHELVEVAEKLPDKPCKTIAKYSFADGEKKVQVYVDWPGVGLHPDKVSCEFGKVSFDLRIQEESCDHRLFVPNLRSDIFPDTSSIRVKENQVVVSLVKAEKGTWYELKKASGF